MKKDDTPFIRRRRAWNVIITVCIFVVAVFAGVYAYAQHMLCSIGRDPDMGLETVSEDMLLQELGWTEVPMKVEATELPVLDDINTEVINILLIGQDRRPGQKTAARSDAMILCTINPAQRKITLTSFMRDMYVPIPGKQSNRINAAYAMGGVKLLDRCIETNFGITIHGNVVVDFAAFTDTINLVGGVDVQMTAKEAQYLNTVTYRDQQWSTGFKEGSNHLDGNQALAYARIRKISGNDFGRTERQRKVLTAIADRVKVLSVFQRHQLLNKLLAYLSTDMTNQQIWSYAINVIPCIKEYSIDSQQIPANGTYKNEIIRGMQVLVPDIEKNRDILRKIMA